MPTLTEHAHADHGRGPQVAQHGVEVGATHRAQAVQAGQHDVARLDADLGDDLDRLGAGAQGDAVLQDAGEQPGVVVRALAVVAPHGDAVHHRHPCGAGGPHQPGDVGDGLALGRFGQLRQGRVRADDRALALLGHDRGVGRIDEVTQVERHQAGFPTRGSTRST